MPKCWDSLERVITENQERVPEVGLFSWLLDGQSFRVQNGIKISHQRNSAHTEHPDMQEPVGEPAA